MKISKSTLEKFKTKCEQLSEEIQAIADDCSLENGESEEAEALWSAQMSIEDAKLVLEDWLS